MIAIGLWETYTENELNQLFYSKTLTFYFTQDKN